MLGMLTEVGLNQSETVFLQMRANAKLQKPKVQVVADVASSQVGVFFIVSGGSRRRKARRRRIRAETSGDWSLTTLL